MNLDELKNSWKEYDTRLQSMQTLNEKLIVSLIKEKSKSRLSNVKRKYLIGIFYMAAWLILGGLIIVINPFDYKHTLEYIPMGVYCLSISILILVMIGTYQKLKNVEINQDSINNSLDRILEVTSKYENPNKLASWTIRLLLISTTVLFPFSFLSRRIEKVGLLNGVVDTIIPILISSLILFIAHKLGVFKDVNSEKFKEYQREFKELKGLSDELKTSE